MIEAHCDYKKPAHYEDLLEVDVRSASCAAASLRFAYDVRRGADVLAEGYTRHAVIGPDGRPRAIPQFMKDLLERDFAKSR